MVSLRLAPNTAVAVLLSDCKTVAAGIPVGPSRAATVLGVAIVPESQGQSMGLLRSRNLQDDNGSHPIFLRRLRGRRTSMRGEAPAKVADLVFVARFGVELFGSYIYYRSYLNWKLCSCTGYRRLQLLVLALTPVHLTRVAMAGCAARSKGSSSQFPLCVL